MSNLLEQWNEHIIRGNQLSRELEDIEDILEKSKGADICFSSGTTGAVFIRVLSQEKMQELRENVVVAIMRTRDDKAAELEKLMGVRKPATINPEFEAAVQEMENQIQKTVLIVGHGLKPTPHLLPPDMPEVEVPKLEMSVEDVRKMYHDENKSMKDIAEYYGVTKSVVNNYIYNNHLSRKKVKEDDVFLDTKVEARTRRERP